MWTSKIASKVFEKGNYQIGVEYTDGASPFTESYTLQAIKDLDFVVSNRLRVLNENDALDNKYELGVFVPEERVSVPEEVTAQERLDSLI